MYPVFNISFKTSGLYFSLVILSPYGYIPVPESFYIFLKVFVYPFAVKYVGPICDSSYCCILFKLAFLSYSSKSSSYYNYFSKYSLFKELCNLLRRSTDYLYSSYNFLLNR